MLYTEQAGVGLMIQTCIRDTRFDLELRTSTLDEDYCGFTQPLQAEKELVFAVVNCRVCELEIVL
jgi:hypothetical protein